MVICCSGSYSSWWFKLRFVEAYEVEDLKCFELELGT